MKKYWWAFVAVAFGLLTSCSLSPEQRAAFTDTMQEMVANGQITQDQFNAIMSAVAAGDWQQVRDIGVSTALGIGGSLLGVRAWRGGVNARKGAVTTP